MVRCIRCGQETLFNGICEKCDEELSRIAEQELRRYASADEVREWTIIHRMEEKK